MLLRSKLLLFPVSVLVMAGCTTSRFPKEAEVYERHAGDAVTEIRLTQPRGRRPVSDDLDRAGVNQ